MSSSNLRIRLSTKDLENIQDALRVICISRPARARQALAALVKFQEAAGGKYFDVSLAQLEIACEALASRYQKTTDHNRANIDEAIEKLTEMLLHPDGISSRDSENGELDYFRNILVNRRAICDRNLHVQLYEPDAACLGMNSGSQRSAAYLTRRSLNLIDENFDDFAGHCKLLVNLPNDVITSKEYQRFHKDRVFVGINDSEGGQLALETLSKLHSEGYRLVLPEASPRLRSIVNLASIVRVDLQTTLRETLRERLEELRSSGARLLVVGVHSPADLQFCRDLKFDFFEGHFFSNPDTKARDVPLNTLSTVRLLAALQNPDVRLQELEEVIRQSLPLSYKLLRFLNSAYVGLPRAVLSIKHAVGLAGIRRIQQWASLLLFSSIEGKPRELFVTASIRARMCEKLADSSDECRQATFFTAGLLSVLDAVLDISINEAVQALPLSDEIREALIERSGPVGAALQGVIAYEQSDWSNPNLARFSTTALREAYLESLHWAMAEVSVISEQGAPTAVNAR